MATLEDSLVASYKTKHTLSMQSSNCVPWYLPKGAENLSIKKPAHGCYIAALFTMAETWKQPRCPSAGEWRKNPMCLYSWTFLSNDKGTNCHPFQLGWVSQALCWVKETCLRRFHAASFQLEDSLQKTNLSWRTPRWLPRLGEGGCIEKLWRVSWGDGAVLNSDGGVGYTNQYMCVETHGTIHQKEETLNFFVCQFF